MRSPGEAPHGYLIRDFINRGANGSVYFVTKDSREYAMKVKLFFLF